MKMSIAGTGRSEKATSFERNRLNKELRVIQTNGGRGKDSQTKNGRDLKYSDKNQNIDFQQPEIENI